VPRVAWISFAPLTKTPWGLTSDLASVRYRLILPAAALQGEGWASRVTYLGPQANQRTLLARFEGCDAVVLGKVWASLSILSDLSKRVVELLTTLQARGTRVIADFCDDHFVHPEIGPVLRAGLGVADTAVASTPGIASVLREYSSGPIHVVTDPVEGPRRDAVVRDLETTPASPTSPLRLLWYGHFSNLRSLELGISQLERFKAGHPIRLTVISAGREAETLARNVDAAWSSSGSGCAFVQWTSGRVFSELAACNAVVIPSNPYDPRKWSKSPNRFAEAVWGGRFTVAHPLPAYQELAPYGCVGEDLAEGLLWYAKNAAAAQERIRRGQAEMQERFAPEAVGRRWREIIETTLGLTPP
jgi:hypothetical protein